MTNARHEAIKKYTTQFNWWKNVCVVDLAFSLVPISLHMGCFFFFFYRKRTCTCVLCFSAF